jgi:hypothetical protein
VSEVYDCEKCKYPVLSEVIFLTVVSSSCCRIRKTTVEAEERRGVLQSPFPIVSQILPLNIFTCLQYLSILSEVAVVDNGFTEQQVFL